nr:MAG TPA: hypothetical protein [Caudoviricetes sp.]
MSSSNGCGLKFGVYDITIKTTETALVTQKWVWIENIISG